MNSPSLSRLVLPILCLSLPAVTRTAEPTKLHPKVAAMLQARELLADDLPPKMRDLLEGRINAAKLADIEAGLERIVIDCRFVQGKFERMNRQHHGKIEKLSVKERRRALTLLDQVTNTFSEAKCVLANRHLNQFDALMQGRPPASAPPPAMTVVELHPKVLKMLRARELLVGDLPHFLLPLLEERMTAAKLKEIEAGLDTIVIDCSFVQGKFQRVNRKYNGKLQQLSDKEKKRALDLLDEVSDTFSNDRCASTNRHINQLDALITREMRTATKRRTPVQSPPVRDPPPVTTAAVDAKRAKLHPKVLPMLQVRELLPGDLPFGIHDLLEGQMTAAKLREIEAVLDSIVIDGDFVQAKFDRINRRYADAIEQLSTKEKKRAANLLDNVSNAFSDGRYVSANRYLNQLDAMRPKPRTAMKRKPVRSLPAAEDPPAMTDEEYFDKARETTR